MAESETDKPDVRLPAPFYRGLFAAIHQQPHRPNCYQVYKERLGGSAWRRFTEHSQNESKAQIYDPDKLRRA